MNPSQGPTHPSKASVRADANRRRILEVALAELLQDPDASMDQIARAAGVVRRTVYGHFPSREALVGALVDEAMTAVLDAHHAGAEGVDDPAESLARSVLAVWEVADRYRLLLSLARRSVTVEGLHARLAPVRAAGAAVIRRGQEQGAFRSPVPAEALSHVCDHVMMGLMDAVNAGDLAREEAGRATAVTFLTAAGLPASDATELVDRITSE
ncbi:TetR/AcrR family transcriptional regulator [Actinomycetota bacterium Odt1-20B]